MNVEKSELVRCEYCDGVGVKERIDHTIYICDECGIVIGGNILELVVFYHSSSLDATDIHCCTWQHLFNQLAMISKSADVSFVHFPTLHIDREGATVQSLLDFITPPHP